MRTAGVLLAPRPDEAFGLSVVEAMARGLPVVAAGSGAHLETVGSVAGRRAVRARRARPTPPGVLGEPRRVDESARDDLRRPAPGRPARALHRRAAGASDRRRLPGPCCDRPRRGLARGLGRRLAPQPAPGLAAARSRDPDLRVLFVEPPADPLHDADVAAPCPPRSRAAAAATCAGAEGRLWLFQPTKWLPRRLDPRRRRAALLGRRRRAARRLGMSGPCSGSTTRCPPTCSAAPAGRPLYDITDDWLAGRPVAARARPAGRAARRYLLAPLPPRRRLLAAAAGDQARRRASPWSRTPSTSTPTAATSPRPADLPRGPVVLYVGTLHRDRLDVELCVALGAGAARDAPRWSSSDPWPSTPRTQHAPDRRRRRPARRRASTPTIPAYLTHADVLVVPHVVTAFTDSLDPIKVYEYLAAARPVVSTPVAGFRDLGRVHVRVASSRPLYRRGAGLVGPR